MTRLMPWIQRRRFTRDSPRRGWQDADSPSPGGGFFEYMGQPVEQRVRRRRERVYGPDGSLQAERDTLDLLQKREPGTFDARAYLDRERSRPLLESFLGHLTLATVHLVAMLVAFSILGPAGYFLAPFGTAVVLFILERFG